MRTIRWLVVGAAAALLVNAGTAAAAPPDFTAAEKLCTAQGGAWLGVRFESGRIVYRCDFSGFGSGREEMDLDKLRTARALCRAAYNGDLLANLLPDAAYYDCFITPS
jgi:hypothetical protein